MKILQGKAIDAKIIRMNLKRHWTVSDFTAKYDITEEGFEKLLKELFHGNISDIKRQLKKNETLKRNSTRAKTNQESEEEKEVKEAVMPEETKLDQNSEIELRAPIAEADENIPDKTQKEAELRQLIEREQKRAEEERNGIIALEINHEGLISRKRVIQTKELPALKQILEQYKEKIKEAQRQVISLNGELNELIVQIDKVNANLNEKRELLQTLESEISALKTVNIFVYSTGEIEISTTMDVQIPEDNEIDWISIITGNSEQCKTMTVIQIQAVAKVVHIVKELESWQTAFEDGASQELFEKLMEKHSK